METAIFTSSAKWTRGQACKQRAMKICLILNVHIAFKFPYQHLRPMRPPNSLRSEIYSLFGISNHRKLPYSHAYAHQPLTQFLDVKQCTFVAPLARKNRVQQSCTFFKTLKMASDTLLAFTSRESNGFLKQNKMCIERYRLEAKSQLLKWDIFLAFIQSTVNLALFARVREKGWFC